METKSCQEFNSCNHPETQSLEKRGIIGQKRPLLPKQVWAMRARLELAGNLADLALFNVAIDSKLRGCNMVKRAVNHLEG